MAGWVVFDGDDTLWQTTPLYDAALARLAKMAVRHGLDPAEMMAWAAERDVERARTMGYSMHRFPGTLREAAARFIGDGTPAEEAYAIGRAVFASTAMPMPGALDLLPELRAAGWRLALFTAGERVVQEKRLTDFPGTHLFEAVRIVGGKDIAAWADFAAALGVAPAGCWAVGDSLRSDVVPAAAVGFSAVHCETANWTGHECADITLPPGAVRVASLAELSAMIGIPILGPQL